MTKKQKLHPDAPRIVLRELVKESRMKQRAVADAVGEREDTFSKRLAGQPNHGIDAPLLLNVLHIIDVDFAVYARRVEAKSEELYAAEGR